MTSNIHIDGGQHAATIEAMAKAIVAVLQKAYECRSEQDTTVVALQLLNRAGFAGPTTIQHCSFTNAPGEPAAKIETEPVNHGLF